MINEDFLPVTKRCAECPHVTRERSLRQDDDSHYNVGSLPRDIVKAFHPLDLDPSAAIDLPAFELWLLDELLGCGAQVPDEDANLRHRTWLGSSRDSPAAAKSNEQQSNSSSVDR